MKKTLSMLLAVMFALTAFGVTTLFGGVLGAGAVFYDYYEYTQIPGFTAFTAEQIADKAWTTSCNFSGFSSDYLPDGNPVEKVATFTCTSPDKWGGMVFAPMELKNDNNNTFEGNNPLGSSPLGSCIWGAMDVIGGKDMLGNTVDDEHNVNWETSFEDCAGFCFWVGVNGGHYDGSIKIQLFAIPCTGPAYATSDDGSTDMAGAQYGFVYECDGVKPDEDGYVYYDFKTDFFQCDWWSKDDEGINHFRTNDPHKYPIPQSKIPYINGIQIRCSNLQSGDVIYIGDWRTYKDTRIHTDELEEQCEIFDALDPEAYTEASYSAATEVYLEAYEMLQNPYDYTQKQVDAMARELKLAIRDLKPMFKARKNDVKLAGFEVWDDDDLEEMLEGGLCIDTAAVEYDNYPANREQAVLVMANSQDGEPTYGWSLFTNGIDEDGDGYADSAVKNPFELEEGSEPLSDSNGIRFWLKWDDESFPVPPEACRIGLGVSSEGIVFECEDTAVELPATQGYVGAAWTAFYDVEGDEDIFDYIDDIDTIYIYLEGAVGIYYIGDLSAFEWSESAADFTELEAELATQSAYIETLDSTLYYGPSWDRVLAAIEAGEGLIGQYGVSQEEVDEALAELRDAINHLTLLGDLADTPTLNMLNALYKSGKTYWRGNLVQRSYMALAEELEIAEEMIARGPKQDEAEAAIAALRDAISGLIPIQPSGTVNTIHSFEKYTTRDLNRASGDRTDNVDYRLDSSFAKLPEGYSQALKMTAGIDMGSETTDEHGMMQFKAMYRDTANHVIPIMLGTNKENTLIGDLSGTAGLCLWVGVNDMNLVQKCTMRVAVSNCTVGPLFERATVDIPVPATGQGWIYLPWEYFEYYDEWTHGQEIDLAKIYFYIIRFDGFIKAGLEVYVTGIHAYMDPVNGSWSEPVIYNVAEGETYDVSEQQLIPDWDVGAAMVDGEYLIYGNPVVKSGAHTLTVTNGNKSTSVNFTVTGGEVEDEQPVISGVANGEEYEEAVSATWTPEGAAATLNGEEYIAGTEISEPGEYTLVVTNGTKSATVSFTIKDQTPPPPVVKKGDADGDGLITVADALAALRIAARLVDSTPEMVQICDTDNDGSITVADALAILRVAAKLADESTLG